MARKPANFQWLGFSEEQLSDLDLLDHIGNNGWARNSQTEALIPSFILDLDPFDRPRMREGLHGRDRLPRQEPAHAGPVVLEGDDPQVGPVIFVAGRGATSASAGAHS